MQWHLVLQVVGITPYIAGKQAGTLGSDFEFDLAAGETPSIFWDGKDGTDCKLNPRTDTPTPAELAAASGQDICLGENDALIIIFSRRTKVMLHVYSMADNTVLNGAWGSEASYTIPTATAADSMNGKSVYVVLTFNDEGKVASAAFAL